VTRPVSPPADALLTPPGNGRSERAWLTGLLLATALLAFYGLGGGADFQMIDCWVGQTAREMHDNGSWLVPRFSGETRMQKSPGPYWAVMLTSRVLQRPIDEFTTRVPSALAAIVLVATVWYLTRRIYDERTARFAGFAAASSALVLWWSHRGASDLGLATCTTVSLALFWTAYGVAPRGSRRAVLIVLGYLAAGVGMLYKMPMPIVVVGLPVATYVVWRAWSDQWPGPRGRRVALALLLLGAGALLLQWLPVVALLTLVSLILLLRRHGRAVQWPAHLLGIVAFLLPWVPWAVLVLASEPTAWQRWEVEFLDRFTGELPNVHGEDHGWFLLTYLVTPLVYCLPYSLSLPDALWRGTRRNPTARGDGPLCMVLWFASLLVFFTAAVGKEDRYLLPALPPLFVLLGPALAYLFDARRAWSRTVRLSGLLATAVLLPAGFAAGGWALATRWYPAIGAPNGFALSDALVPYSVTAGLFVLGAVLAAGLFAARRPGPAFATLVGGVWATWLWTWPTLVPVLVSERPARDLAAQMQARLTSEMRADLRYVGFQDSRLIWYSDIRIPRLIDPLDLLALQAGDRSLAREQRLYAEEIVRRLRGEARTLLVAGIVEHLAFMDRVPPALADRGESMPPVYRWLVTARGPWHRATVVFGNQPPPWEEPPLPELPPKLQARFGRAAPATTAPAAGDAP
jgi:4-amino-4-deoxy-L-arabinose transferase-like glycosyltransferase